MHKHIDTAHRNCKRTYPAQRIEHTQTGISQTNTTHRIIENFGARRWCNTEISSYILQRHPLRIRIKNLHFPIHSLPSRIRHFQWINCDRHPSATQNDHQHYKANCQHNIPYSIHWNLESKLIRSVLDRIRFQIVQSMNYTPCRLIECVIIIPGRISSSISILSKLQRVSSYGVMFVEIGVDPLATFSKNEIKVPDSDTFHPTN